MQLDVDTVSKMDLNLLPAGPKAAETVLAIRPGGFKISQISMLIDALQRILHLCSADHTFSTVLLSFY